MRPRSNTGEQQQLRGTDSSSRENDFLRCMHRPLLTFVFEGDADSLFTFEDDLSRQIAINTS